MHICAKIDADHNVIIGLGRDASMIEGLIVSDIPLGAERSLTHEYDAVTIPVTIIIEMRLNGIVCVIHRDTSFPVLIVRSTLPTCSWAAARFRMLGSKALHIQ